MILSQAIFVAAIVAVGFFLIINIRIILKIKQYRELGVKLSNRNWYYKVLSKLFIKDLPS